ncbi:MAG: cytochrome P450 [Candidatus Eisenbacteria bacterium]|uniref:Cytochrome P450 n=1 Tax=Eiseniibacteriota bacterium TaxID=2212470 RepID=A0A538SZU6_UNCEI|nr:MAG: cytochrome P450 [Candidatus Eisenbacteria bacterium]
MSSATRCSRCSRTPRRSRRCAPTRRACRRRWRRSYASPPNRDEAVFEHADVFDIGREQKPDVAFGFGPHYCLGASLATLEAEVALRVLLARTRRFRRVDDAPLPIPPSIVFRGVTRLPVVLEPA